MALITINGTLKDSNGNPLAGQIVQMHNTAHSNLDQDTTDSQGNYSVAADESNGVLHAHFEGDPPHYAEDTSPGEETAGTHTHDLVSAFSNNAPSLDGSMADQSFQENSGVQSDTVPWSDADGDSVTVEEVIFVPAWVTLSIDGSDVKHSWNTDAASEGTHEVEYWVEDEFGEPSLHDSYEIEITPEPSAPEFQPVADRLLVIGTSPIQFQLQASDVDGDLDENSFRKTAGSPSFVSVTAGGLVTIDPSDVGLLPDEYTSTYLVDDDLDNTGQVSHTITLVLADFWVYMTPIM